MSHSAHAHDASQEQDVAESVTPFIPWVLPLAGVLTAVPLALFAVGAKRLPLATVGFLQFIAPSLNFVLAVLVFREPFDSAQLIGFMLIWAALAIYSVDMARVARRGT